jgi:hypothetical protein
MLVQPFNNAKLNGPSSVTLGPAAVLLGLIAPRIGAVRTARERCQEVGFCLADPTNERGGDRGPSGAQDETVARRLDRRPDPGKILKEIAGDAHIALSKTP